MNDLSLQSVVMRKYYGALELWNPTCHPTHDSVHFDSLNCVLKWAEQFSSLTSFPPSQSGWGHFMFTACRISRAFQIIKIQRALMRWSTLDFPQYLAFKGTISISACYFENVNFCWGLSTFFEALVVIA